MLLTLPVDLSLAIVKEWLGSVVLVSALDVAFCSSTQRPAFLELISDPRCGEVFLDKFTVENELDDDMGFELAIPFLRWLESRHYPLRKLILDSRIHWHSEINLHVILNCVEKIVFIPSLRSSDLQYLDLKPLICSCPQLTSFATSGRFFADKHFGYLFADIHEHRRMQSLCFDHSLVLADDGVCSMAQWFGKTLTELKLSSAFQITDVAVNNISKHCKKLEIAALNCSQVTLAALTKLLKSCKKLWSLQLVCPLFTSEIIQQLLQTPCSLESLVLTECDINLTVMVADLLAAIPGLAMAQVNQCYVRKIAYCPAYGNSVVASKQAMQFLAAHHISSVEVRRVLSFSSSIIRGHVENNEALLQILRNISGDLQEIKLRGNYSRSVLNTIANKFGCEVSGDFVCLDDGLIERPL